ncbi:MAG: aryl-sulfate sulfotransferase [Velocimicrobium sp.]
MKKILKIFAITNVLILALVAVAGFFLYQNYNKGKKETKKVALEELDMQVYGVTKEDISEDVIYPLYLSGAEKNVETYAYDSTNDIYNVKTSKHVKADLEEKKKKTKYTIDNCLWAYNPFGTHDFSLYLYLKATDVTSLRYTVHVEDENIPDFTRTANVDASLIGTKEIECLIAGLVPGVQNYIILKLENDSGKIIKRIVYSLTPPKTKGEVQNQLILTDGPSLTERSNGLYMFFGHDAENKKMRPAIYLFDNSGILRGSIPIVKGETCQVLFLNGCMLYNYSGTNFASVSPLGQVVKIYQLSGYRSVNDYVYDGFGNIVTIATKKGASSIEDQLVSINLETGKTAHLVDMRSLLKKVKKKSTDSSDWIGLNSVVWAGSDSVLVSARELSGILKIRNISSVNPTIEYIIGDASLWKKQGKTKGLLTKYVDPNNTTTLNTDPFLSQYGQSSLALSTIDEQYPSNETQYYLTMFDNNYKKKKTDTSYYYKYYVDETAGTYDLAKTFKIPYSTYESSVQEYAGNIIVNSGTDCSVGEYDTEGGLISQLKYNVETYTYRVMKFDFKNFWFS